MLYTLKENESDARERLRAFWAGASLGRPALHITVQRPGFLREAWPYPEMTGKERDYCPEWHAHCARNWLASVEYLAEAMPGTQPVFASHLGTPVVLAGGEYDYHDSAWIQPLPELWEHPLPVFAPTHPYVVMMNTTLQRLAVDVGAQGFINPPAMLDGLTILSAFRTAEQLCLDLLETPGLVKRWSEALTTLYIETYDYFYRQVKALGYGDTTTWLQAMAEGSLEGVQCDIAVMLSPKMYEEFVLPDLRRLTDYLDYSLYHLDGTCQMRFLELLRTLPGLKGIQWNPEPSAGSPVRWLEALREIRRHGFCLHVWCTDAEEAVVLAKELGPDGLLLAVPCLDTMADAHALIRRIERACSSEHGVSPHGRLETQTP